MRNFSQRKISQGLNPAVSVIKRNYTQPLAHLHGTVVGYRQIIDIPLPQPETTEYDMVEKVCECGCKVRGESVTGFQVKGWRRVFCSTAFCYGYGKEEWYAYIPSGQIRRGIFSRTLL